MPGTIAADCEEIDGYLLGINEPVEQYEGHGIAIIYRKDDIEDKLFITPDGSHFNDEEIISKTHFQEQFFSIELLR